MPPPIPALLGVAGAAPGTQLTFCTPLHAAAAGIVRDRMHTRSSSADLFISELWKLLDTIKSQIFFSSLPIGQDSGKQDRIKKARY